MDRFETKINNTKITVLQGDITQQDTEAVVNAANSSLMGGGGVDGAIHRRGGPRILEECRKIVEKIGHLEPGGAVITTGGDLKAGFVIHTVGPFWRGGTKSEEIILKNAYLSSLAVAKEHNIKTISFPSISTGAYRFPINSASRIAVDACIKYIIKHNYFEEVRFVLFSQADYKVYLDTFGSKK
ncbi:MAG: O-acetyl-ADP-ribose deacetylase [Endomicrobiales bacterium]|nr:O-acetyl-ADP-ribose deacetylase [Endomicrobiales bacterium]